MISGIRQAGLGLVLGLWGCGPRGTHPSTSHDQTPLKAPFDQTSSQNMGISFQESQTDREEVLTTRYPVVLAHGLLGYDRILTLDYYFKIPGILRNAGVDVFVTRVDPVATIATRGKQLSQQIDEILKKTGATKVNLIGHSMGGLDARYVVGTLGYGDRVATLTTLGSPNHGTLVADLIYNAVKAGYLDNLEGLLRAITGTPLPCDQPWERHCAREVMRSAWNIRGVAWNLSAEFMTKHFNPANKPDPRVLYQSFSGLASRWGWPGRPPKVEEIFAPVYLYLLAVSGDNDGLVPTTSSQYGEDRGILPADHLDMIGHLMGDSGGQFDHVQFFRQYMGELRSRGF